MALATQHFDLYIIPNTTPPPVLDISQYDTSRTFVGHVKDIHGKPYSLPNGTTALLEGRNGNGIIFRLNASVNGDTITFTPDDILTDTSGRIHATISLDSTGQQLSPLRIIFNVQRAGITKEERTTNPDFKDAVAAAFQAYIDEHGSDGGGGSGEMNVQSDWNQGNINADDYIKNKPTKLSQFQNDSGYITSSDISNKVDKVSGKGLSTNDYTTAEKTKLSNIAAGAQVNTIEAITLNGSTVQPDSNKIVNLTISGGGTSSVTSVNGKTGAVILKTSDLTNDSGYLTSHQDISGKVDKVSGKGLSTNDYTTAEKNKLSGIASGAQVNTIETIKVNGTALTPDSNKAVNISISSSGSGGLPSGGTTGQVLTKTSSGEAWQNVPTELPSGGSTGQVLKKTSSGVAWQNESSGSSITVDSALSTTSTNPVQNKVITNAINAKGTYSKPSGGIPKTDLASAIQTSLGKADTALQTPSSYSNGQVLMVQNGSWVASNPPTELPSDGSVGQVLKKTQSGIAWQNESGGSGSGSDMFVLHLTGNTTSGYQITESAADIIAHYPNIILIYEDVFTDGYCLVGARLVEEDMWGYLWFARDENWMTDGTVSRDFVDLSLTWDTENPNYGVSAYRSSTALRKLPQASNVQNGKVLGVVGGNYSLVNIATNTLFYIDDTTVKSAATNLACTGQDIIDATVAKGVIPVIKFTENYIDYFLYLDNAQSAGLTFKALDGSRELLVNWGSSTAYVTNS